MAYTSRAMRPSVRWLADTFQSNMLESQARNTCEEYNTNGTSTLIPGSRWKAKHRLRPVGDSTAGARPTPLLACGFSQRGAFGVVVVAQQFTARMYGGTMVAQLNCNALKGGVAPV